MPGSSDARDIPRVTIRYRHSGGARCRTGSVGGDARGSPVIVLYMGLRQLGGAARSRGGTTRGRAG
jgi:hypothetical protein